MKRFLLALLLSVMSSAALAQTTGAVNPSAAPAQPSANADVPPGGCMPIGLTTSGEIVFPIECKEFIEQHRGKDVEQNSSAAVEQNSSAAVEQKPAAVEDKPADKQSEAVAPAAPANNQSAGKSVETVPLPRRAERKLREHVSSREHVSLNGCQHYRTYDPESGTYRGYDG